jgi:hypothetical protein
MTITVETKREVWEDVESGYHWRVGPDGDGLDFVEIAYIEAGEVHTALTMRPDVARKVAECLLKSADEVEASA